MTREKSRRAKRGEQKIPTTGPEVLRAEARDVPTASSPAVREAGEARASAASAARPISAERSEAAKRDESDESNERKEAAGRGEAALEALES